MSKMQVTIGIEIHLELNTKTKMFSAAPNQFGAKPNTQVSVIDLGYPGTLPAPNEAAVKKGIKLAKALKMTISQLLIFDRKNYFYPDLPKGYQITQDQNPLGKNGVLPILVNEKYQDVAIERIHLEEDTAKSSHHQNQTLLDFNRAGIPLIEIVSRPVLHSAIQARAYVQAIRDLARCLNISDAKMEEGSLRADINLSLNQADAQELGTKVEIKNLNSLANIKKAIDFEIKIQSKRLLAGQKIEQATKRFDENLGQTVVMRSKIDAIDYKYFPEPNITPMPLTNDFIEAIKNPELPWEKYDRYLHDGLEIKYILQLLSNFLLAQYFDQIVYDNRNQLAKIFFAEIVKLLNNNSSYERQIKPSEISDTLTLLKKNKLSRHHLKVIFPELIKQKLSVVEIIKLKKLNQDFSPEQVKKIVQKVISDNQGFIEQNQGRPERVIKYIVGQVMKNSQGQANPVLAAEIVNQVLKE